MVLVTFTNLALTILLFYMVGRSLDITIAMYTLPWIVAMVFSLILFGLLLLMGLAGGILEIREFIQD